MSSLSRNWGMLSQWHPIECLCLHFECNKAQKWNDRAFVTTTHVWQLAPVSPVRAAVDFEWTHGGCSVTDCDWSTPAHLLHPNWQGFEEIYAAAASTALHSSPHVVSVRDPDAGLRNACSVLRGSAFIGAGGAENRRQWVERRSRQLAGEIREYPEEETVSAEHRYNSNASFKWLLLQL